MGVWTEVNGLVSISENCKCSLEEVAKELCDESSVSVHTLENNRSLRALRWTFEEGGTRADKIICDFMKKVLEYDKRARFDITASIRYLT